MEIKTIMPPDMSTKINMNRGFARKSNLPDMMDMLPKGMSKMEAPNVDLGRTKDNSLQSQSMQTLNARTKPMGSYSAGMNKSMNAKQSQY